MTAENSLISRRLVLLQYSSRAATKAFALSRQL
jgi:hypothetical protein